MANHANSTKLHKNPIDNDFNQKLKRALLKLSKETQESLYFLLEGLAFRGELPLNNQTKSNDGAHQEARYE